MLVAVLVVLVVLGVVLVVLNVVLGVLVVVEGKLLFAQGCSSYEVALLEPRYGHIKALLRHYEGLNEALLMP